MSWEEIELKEVSKYRTEKINTTEIETNYISTENMLPEKGGIIVSSYPPTSKTVASFKTNDVLVSNIRPYFKKIWFADFDGGCSNDVIVFKSDERNLIPKFLYYQLSKDEFFDFMMSGANGTKMPRGNRKAIPKFKLLLPPIPTQKRIADILSSYDDLLQNNLKRIKLLEQAAQNIYKEWFVNLRFPGQENTPINEETGLPEEWEEKALGDIITKLESGSRPKGGIDKTLKEGVPSVGAESVRGLGYFDFSKTKYVKTDFFEKMRKGILEDRDILIYKDGAYIGRSTLFQDNFPFEQCSINEHIFLIHATNEEFQYYLYFTLHSDLYFEKMQNLNSNAAQPGINQKKIKTLPVITPTLDLLLKFDSIVEPIVKQIYQLAKMNLELKTGRDILLPRLMNSTIEV